MENPEKYVPTERTRARRGSKRAAYDAATVRAILDEGLVCHVGFVWAGHPYVLPMAYARAGDRLYLHGSTGSRMLRALRDGIPACVTVTLLDGLVLARSAFHHSMNYRSVVLLGRARELTDPLEKRRALDAFMDHAVPGRLEEVREPSPEELQATMVLEIPIEEVSAKIRTGPPLDDEADRALRCWAGVIPLRLTASALQGDPRMDPGIAPPAYASAYRRGRSE